MRKAKGLGVTAAFVIWISLIAYPALHWHRDRAVPRPTEQTLNQPGLFFPLLGAWSLPESPMVGLSPEDAVPTRR
jgi:hypothetical protein